MQFLSLKIRKWAKRSSWVALLGAALIHTHAGTLNVSFNSIPQGSVVNLTQEGVLDWVHWGLFTESSVNRKGSVTPQIGDFTPVHPSNNYTFIYQYADNWNRYSWSDGVPLMSVTNTPTGVWAYASGPGGIVLVGSGFQFTCTASTNLQVLRVYVGAYAARGKFTASLSDTSAPAYSSPVNQSVYNTGNGPSAVYTLTFAANSTNQFLTVTYTLETLAPGHIYDGNVTLQSAALSAPGANNIPFVALTAPANSTSVMLPTNLTLTASATDQDGSVTLIEFFSGTNKLGDIAPPATSFVWTNPPVGRHILTARAIDNAAGVGVSQPITVFVATNTGALAGTRATAPLTLNLTTEGTSDWAHWGLLNSSNFNHRAAGGSQISDPTRIGTNAFRRYTDNRTAFTWTDGTPTPSTASTNAGIYIRGLTNGFQFTAPADTNMRTLRVYAGLYGSHGNFQAWLDDFSAPAFTDMTLSNVFGNTHVVYTLNYRAASANRKLIVRYTIQNLFDTDFGNITLPAATLQGPPPQAPLQLFNFAHQPNAFRFSFLSAPGKTYAAQFTPSLAPLSWQTFTNITGTGTSLSVTDQVITIEPRFYRIISE